MSPKIRKKDPCPCGSGKKYRNCCFKTRKYSGEEVSKIRKEDKEEIPLISRLALMRFNQDLFEDEELVKELGKTFTKIHPERDFKEWLENLWDDKKVGKMSTESILEKLESIGVVFDEEQFKILAREYISAITLADEVYYPEGWDEHGVHPDDDFIWLAIAELWKRILPDHYNVEMLDDALHKGYNLIKKGNYTEGLTEWLDAWTIVLCIIPPHITSMEEADAFMPYPLTQYLVDWCYDLDEELCKVEDKSWLAKRIAFASEFCQRFPDTGGSILPDLMKAEAESYCKLGEVEKAEPCFEQLAQKVPDYVWGYIGWGDSYWLFDEEHYDYEKAERIYRLGLDHCDSEKDVIHKRLKELEKKKNKMKK